MFDRLRDDIRTVMERDPAARSSWEVILCYPGVHALAFHRVAHRLWRAGWTTSARWVSHLSRFFTGIEIHPAARLGRGLFIDHGMGVVIGETSEVGENVTLYQGVSLAGTSLKKEKRHPTLGNNVTVGAGAKVIGGFTIGDNSRIGAGSVVVREVPPNCVVVGVPLDWAMGAVRSSLGRSTTADDVDYVVASVAEVVAKVRKAMPVPAA